MKHPYLEQDLNTIWDPPDVNHGIFERLWLQGRIPIPQGAHVLELGSAEADWLTPMKRIRPDLHLTGTDQRVIPARPGADALVTGNLLEAGLFPSESFDVIVACSVIGHVGIGRYGDPQDPDGDSTAMRHLKSWLKPNGLLYMDVPYRGDGPSTPFRAYSEADVLARLTRGWREVDRQVVPSSHPDGPYLALVLRS